MPWLVRIGCQSFNCLRKNPTEVITKIIENFFAQLNQLILTHQFS